MYRLHMLTLYTQSLYYQLPPSYIYKWLCGLILLEKNRVWVKTGAHSYACFCPNSISRIVNSGCSPFLLVRLAHLCTCLIPFFWISVSSELQTLRLVWSFTPLLDHEYMSADSIWGLHQLDCQTPRVGRGGGKRGMSPLPGELGSPPPARRFPMSVNTKSVMKVLNKVVSMINFTRVTLFPPTRFCPELPPPSLQGTQPVGPEICLSFKEIRLCREEWQEGSTCQWSSGGF